MATEDGRKFVHWRGETISGLTAKLRYPDPKFFLRGDMRMRREDLCSLVMRNADEIRHVIYLLESAARPDAIGSRARKADLLHRANMLHDWRVSVDMHGGEKGRPYLWEV